ncbi:hypothetical protein ASF49_00250 [Methylobacterium sp. Leaf104]|uniref:hypothetical protein n=1 Tax=Methylobacterium TaxID=407 RepID=UPI000701C5C7|nr:MULTISPECIES: hypothetical protein [Methylobacterium]KQP42331.1 hypothetical protein ASF49_00250 [Methylobacterium sp. Leaf104]MCI9879152.1 hypothetical protein [Methylobacterium goesingense]
MRQSLRLPLAAALLVSLAAPALAAPACLDAQRKVDEANALRYQFRQEARLGNHDRVCDTLDEIGDRYADARDAFEDCGAGVIAIDLRSESRALRVAKRVHRCD